MSVGHEREYASYGVGNIRLKLRTDTLIGSSSEIKKKKIFKVTVQLFQFSKYRNNAGKPHLKIKCLATGRQAFLGSLTKDRFLT